ncbi:response regulator transcription factor [Microcoleus sp. FACHB-1515]|uniref:LuxR C-terminal-related transcriptional regulator n=1 Tax=Cyanophyceae TaxID=3028117 RepID=UPI001686398D|nr:response regulator transcription factor [Microcoleus sp. FACHB-1515]MBD2093187.1 response regulator transcription factor [Microcoleus sp. FACHB-1515]
MVASFHTAPRSSSTYASPICPASRLVQTQRVSVLIVDDQPQVCQGLHTLLEFYSRGSSIQFSIAGEASTYADALKLAADQPTLILLNLELKAQENSIAMMRRLREFYQGKVLVLSEHREDDLVFQAMQAGASGYIVKERMAAQLCIAISVILANQVYLTSEGMTQFFRSFRSHYDQAALTEQKIHLSDREREVLSLLVEGEPNARIAEQLYITVATVKAHLTSIFEKLGVKNRSQAIVTALKLNLV